MSLLVNSHPRSFLKKYASFCKELEQGVWQIDSNFCKIYLIELHKINLDGMDRLYLSNFSTDEVLSKVLKKIESSSKNSKEAKWIDKIKKIIYDRVVAFEKDPETRRKYMATAYEADITDLVKPYTDKARQEGELKGKKEGEFKTNLETARNMKDLGLSLDIIQKSVGLSEEELKKNGIL
jgi:predicted transposase/invertase (TIGR01784 family)